MPERPLQWTCPLFPLLMVSPPPALYIYPLGLLSKISFSVYLSVFIAAASLPEHSSICFLTWPFYWMPAHFLSAWVCPPDLLRVIGCLSSADFSKFCLAFPVGLASEPNWNLHRFRALVISGLDSKLLLPAVLNVGRRAQTLLYQLIQKDLTCWKVILLASEPAK